MGVLIEFWNKWNGPVRVQTNILKMTGIFAK